MTAGRDRAEPPEIATYPGKRFLEDEMTWMLWWSPLRAWAGI